MKACRLPGERKPACGGQTAQVNPYEPEVDWFTRDVEIHPINDAPEPKRRFMPSKWEEKKCGAFSPLGSHATHLYLAFLGFLPGSTA